MGLKGIITWQYNDYIGTKPDVGANIALIPKDLKPKDDNDGFCLTLSQVPQGKDGIYSAETDGYGYYEIQNVPVGIYRIIIKSNSTSRNPKKSTYDSYSVLKNNFTEHGLSNLKLVLDYDKHWIATIEIKPDQTITQSLDFGNTDF